MLQANRSENLFSLGQCVATPHALEALAASGQVPKEFFDRHGCGDWGEVDAEDAKANQDALLHGERLLSAYRTTSGVRIWIITEADRSATTVLLPEEY